eukprot:2648076-Amphidinium_carterae.1
MLEASKKRSAKAGCARRTHSPKCTAILAPYHNRILLRRGECKPTNHDEWGWLFKGLAVQSRAKQ